MSIMDSYCMKMPSPQNALDIFAGEWACYLPGGLTAGAMNLHSDARTIMMQEALGSFAGLDVLELGPLEGAHTAQLQWMGANSILAIEANQRAYLKTLISKEILGLDRARIMLGDFNSYLTSSTKRFDFILAAGVIYHMANPVETLGLILKHTDKIGIWSHYYDKALHDNDGLKHKFSRDAEKLEGFGITVGCHRQDYAESLNFKGFSGGGQLFSYWIPKQGWFDIFEHHGFTLEILQDQPDHQHGPSFTAVGKRK